MNINRPIYHFAYLTLHCTIYSDYRYNTLTHAMAQWHIYYHLPAPIGLEGSTMQSMFADNSLSLWLIKCLWILLPGLMTQHFSSPFFQHAIMSLLWQFKIPTHTTTMDITNHRPGKGRVLTLFHCFSINLTCDTYQNVVMIGCQLTRSTLLQQICQM